MRNCYAKFEIYDILASHRAACAKRGGVWDDLSKVGFRVKKLASAILFITDQIRILEKLDVWERLKRLELEREKWDRKKSI